MIKPQHKCIQTWHLIYTILASYHSNVLIWDTHHNTFHLLWVEARISLLSI
jgi:hypothetical protein